MKNKILRVAASLLMIVVLALSFAGCESKTKRQAVSPTEKFFVNDFAGVINEADANSMYSSGVALQEATSAQVVVVTVDSLDDYTIEDYALEIGRTWGVGDKDKDNGVVVLLSVQDREIYIAVGYGLEGALPDSKTGRIIDNYGLSYFSSDNFSAGLMGIYNAITNEIYIEYGMQPSENYIPVDLLPDTNGKETSAGEVVASWIILIALVAIYLLIFGRRGLLVFGAPHGYGGFYHRGGFGGSSGGFGGFSGGGGSFGGGGAGRKF